MRIIAVALLVALLAGCGSSVIPGTGDRYTGEPTDLVLEIRRSDVSPQGMKLMADGEEMHQVIVKVERGSIYQAFRFLEIPADQDQVVVDVELPSATGYSVSAITYANSVVLEEGHRVDVAAAAGTGNIVVLELGAPEYEVTLPDAVYSGGVVRQFKVTVPTASILQNEVILLGLQPWSSFGEWASLPQHWFSISADRFPQVTEPARVYYQIRLCVPASDLPEPGNVCYYEPAMGDPLPYVDLLPGPPPN